MPGHGLAEGDLAIGVATYRSALHRLGVPRHEIVQVEPNTVLELDIATGEVVGRTSVLLAPATSSNGERVF